MNSQRMKDSSISNNRAFDNLGFEQVGVLLDTLKSSRLRTRPHVERKFSQQAQGFDETVAFLIRVGMVKERDDSLSMSIEWPETKKAEKQACVLHSLLRVRNRYRSEVFRFVSGFAMVDGELAYFSSAQFRSSESSVRNFLMELGIVKHEPGTEKYLLAPEYVSLFASAKDDANYTAPSTLSHDLVTKSEIGFAAEEAILSYERARVGRLLTHKVDHVSQRNVAAGYDIRSFTVEGSDSIFPRFIEVKAVPKRSFRFYWSRNEVDVARVMADWDYLYLLPVDKHGLFDIARLKIIANPYDVVLAEATDWICESDALRCYLR